MRVFNSVVRVHSTSQAVNRRWFHRRWFQKARGEGHKANSQTRSKEREHLHTRHSGTGVYGKTILHPGGNVRGRESCRSAPAYTRRSFKTFLSHHDKITFLHYNNGKSGTTLHLLVEREIFVEARKRDSKLPEQNRCPRTHPLYPLCMRIINDIHFPPP